MVMITKHNVERLVSDEALPPWLRRGFAPCDGHTDGREGESGMPLSPASPAGLSAAASAPSMAQLRQSLAAHGIGYRRKDTKSVLMRRAQEAGLLPDGGHNESID